MPPHLTFAAAWTAATGLLAFTVHNGALRTVDAAILQLVADARWPQLDEIANWLFRLGFLQVDAAIAAAWTAILLLRARHMPPEKRAMASRALRQRARMGPDISLQACAKPRADISLQETASVHVYPPIGHRATLSAYTPLLVFAIIATQAALRLVVNQPAPGTHYALPRPLTTGAAGAALDAADANIRRAFQAASADEQRNTFPSGHAARALFLALLAASAISRLERVSRALRRAAAAALVALGLLVGYTTLYFGYHWPSDVLAGFTIAAAAFHLARHLQRGQPSPLRT